jgi:hypothetical protein
MKLLLEFRLHQRQINWDLPVRLVYRIGIISKLGLSQGEQRTFCPPCAPVIALQKRGGQSLRELSTLHRAPPYL